MSISRNHSPSTPTKNEKRKTKNEERRILLLPPTRSMLSPMPIRFTFMMLDDPPLEGRALRARSRGPSTPRLSPTPKRPLYVFPWRRNPFGADRPLCAYRIWVPRMNLPITVVPKSIPRTIPAILPTRALFRKRPESVPEWRGPKAPRPARRHKRAIRI